MKRCQYCGTEYSDDTLVCTVDQQPLAPPAENQRAATTENSLPKEKHSGLGIASFAISIAVGCLMFAVFVIGAVLNAGRVERGSTYPGQVFVGLAIIGLMGIDLIAAGLGIASFFPPKKKRIFGILGLVFSSVTVLGTVGLILLGLSFINRYRQ